MRQTWRLSEAGLQECQKVSQRHFFFRVVEHVPFDAGFVVDPNVIFCELFEAQPAENQVESQHATIGDFQFEQF